MSEMPDHYEFDKRLAVLEERMKTLKAENTSAQERLNATLERFHTAVADLRAENAQRDKEAAQRETAHTRWIMASIMAAAGLIVIILGFMLRLPVAS